MNIGNTHNRKGGFLENVALRWLKARGLKVVAKNYISRAGEIDIIMLDHGILCFIEVNYQGNPGSGNTGYGIPLVKQQRIIQTASSFTKRQDKFLHFPKRFDVLIIEPGVDEPYKMNWIKQAFIADTYL